MKRICQIPSDKKISVKLTWRGFMFDIVHLLIPPPMWGLTVSPLNWR
jgi:hypothetical protein